MDGSSKQDTGGASDVIARLLGKLQASIASAEHPPGTWRSAATEMGGVATKDVDGSAASIGLAIARGSEEVWGHFGFKRDSYLAVEAVEALPALMSLAGSLLALSSEQGPRGDAARELLGTGPVSSQAGHGAGRIVAERMRQLFEKGFDEKHDEQHSAADLAFAACCYASPVPLYRMVSFGDGVSFRDPWPWEGRWDRRPWDAGKRREPTRGERIRLLEKAGALIAAALDKELRDSEG